MDRDAVVEVLIAEHESWPCISLKEGEESGEMVETPQLDRLGHSVFS
jgi:hypothetical protein